MAKIIVCEAGYTDTWGDEFDFHAVAQRLSEESGFQVEFGPTNGLSDVFETDDYEQEQEMRDALQSAWEIVGEELADGNYC